MQRPTDLESERRTRVVFYWERINYRSVDINVCIETSPRIYNPEKLLKIVALETF